MRMGTLVGARRGDMRYVVRTLLADYGLLLMFGVLVAIFTIANRDF